jgi:hypothetical protein
MATSQPASVGNLAAAAPAAAPAPSGVTPYPGMPALYYPAAKPKISNLVPGTGYAATIASVVSGGAVNVAVWDAGAIHHAMLNVQFIQLGQTPPASAAYVTPQTTESIVVPTPA